MSPKLTMNDEFYDLDMILNLKESICYCLVLLLLLLSVAKTSKFGYTELFCFKKRRREYRNGEH